MEQILQNIKIKSFYLRDPHNVFFIKYNLETFKNFKKLKEEMKRMEEKRRALRAAEG